MSHDKGQDDEKFERRTQALFAASVERLDGRTRSKLTQARHAALEEARQRRFTWHQSWLPLGGATAAAVLAIWIAVGQFGSNGRGTENGAIPLDDLDMVAESADLNLLQDVDFYAWMARQDTDLERNSG